MIGQLSLSLDGRIRDKVEMSLDILRQFEPAEGYYLAFSGGKDSQCVYHLAKMAGVKFDAHYSVTSVDPPELVRFIKTNYPDVKFEIPHDKDGKPITMWNLIPKRLMPPTKIVRYCCEALKESHGKYRVTMTGVRKSESINRKKNQGMVTVMSPGKKVVKQIEETGAEFTKTDRGGLILNYDNDDSKNVVDLCYRTTKTLINPIIEWDEEDVWHFLNSNGIEHCCLYDEGSKRIGCIGCPMGTISHRIAELERWPKYKEGYKKAFKRMLEVRNERGVERDWNTPEEVFDWWLRE